MHFLPKLQLFLKENGVIYTVRRYKMEDDIVKVDGVGICHRIPLGQVRKEHLEPFVAVSGFKTLADWWQMITVFCPENHTTNRYLYRVERIKDESLQENIV